MFNRLDRLVFSEWMKMFVLSIGVLVGLFLVADAQNNLNDLFDYGASGTDILRYYLILTPTLLPTILPLSVLVSLLISLSTMHRRLELVAMRNAGISLARITLPLWLTAVLLAGLLFWLNAQFVPWAKEASRELWNQYRFQGELVLAESAQEVGVVHNLTFNNPDAGRRWFINRFSEYDYNAYGLTITMLDEAGRVERQLIANRGYFDDIAGHWVLLEGRELSFAPERGDIVRNLGFERQVAPDLNEDPVLMQFLKKRPQDLSFWQLRRVMEALYESEDPLAAQYALRHYRILVNPLDVLIALALAVHFAVGAVRANALVGVAKGIALYVLYFVLSQSTGLIGGAYLTPFMAALLPSILMLGLALFLVSRTGRPV